MKGQIVDVSCYNADKTNNAGNDHKMPKGDTKDCAIGCARPAVRWALLTSDGKVYVLTGGLAAEKNAKIVAARRAHRRNHGRCHRGRRQDDACGGQPEDDFEVDHFSRCLVKELRDAQNARWIDRRRLRPSRLTLRRWRRKRQ